jgi:hypothetical protein
MPITAETIVWKLVEQLILILYPLCLVPAILLVIFETRNRRRSEIRPKGCKRIELQSYSNITDECDDHKYAAGVDAG